MKGLLLMSLQDLSKPKNKNTHPTAFDQLKLVEAQRRRRPISENKLFPSSPLRQCQICWLRDMSSLGEIVLV